MDGKWYGPGQVGKVRPTGVLALGQENLDGRPHLKKVVKLETQGGGSVSPGDAVRLKYA